MKMGPDDNAKAPRPKRKFAWYGLTALALLAILLLNKDTKVVDYESGGDFVGQPTSSKSGIAGPPDNIKPIKQISILGERNSGTRWTYSHLGQCFNSSLYVKRSFTRYKHWFQYKNASKYKHDTLVIAQFRNAYDWLEAMRKVPHHASEHLYLEWQEFLEKPWTTKRSGLDLNVSKTEICQEEFPYNEIVSCVREPIPRSAYDHKLHYSEQQPFYELKPDGSGEAFENIMAMRAGKIRNMLGVRDHEGVADVWSVQYEYLLNKGTDELLTKIEEWTGHKRTCEAVPPQDRRKRPLSRSFAQYVNDHLDWSAENLIGYVKEDIP